MGNKEPYRNSFENYDDAVADARRVYAENGQENRKHKKKNKPNCNLEAREKSHVDDNEKMWKVDITFNNQQDIEFWDTEQEAEKCASLFHQKLQKFPERVSGVRGVFMNDNCVVQKWRVRFYHENYIQIEKGFGTKSEA